MSVKSGIQAVIAAKGGKELQERVAAQVVARLDGARQAGLVLHNRTPTSPKGYSL